MNGMEWISVSQQLPREGQLVKIKIGPMIKENVLFKDGRFWRLRMIDGSGHVWEPEVWAPMEKKHESK